MKMDVKSTFVLQRTFGVFPRQICRCLDLWKQWIVQFIPFWGVLEVEFFLTVIPSDNGRQGVTYGCWPFCGTWIQGTRLSVPEQPHSTRHITTSRKAKPHMPPRAIRTGPTIMKVQTNGAKSPAN